MPDPLPALAPAPALFDVTLTATGSTARSHASH